MNAMIKSYSELMTFETFEKRFEYLYIGGKVGKATFGSKRYLNQKFYKSKIWRDFRNEIIVRDKGLDLAVPGYDILDYVTVHHINPIPKEMLDDLDFVLNPENVITVSDKTHKAIHYGNQNIFMDITSSERKPYDTCPWRNDG